MRPRRLYQRLRQGHYHNIRFSDLEALARALGFSLDRVRGGHHIFRHGEIEQLLNLQEVDGMAKPYQARQLKDLIDRYNLQLGSKR